MRILAVSDEESRYLWDFFEKEKLKDIDLILSAGDLKPEYLSFLTTMYAIPVLYVHGNHDGKYDQKPPEGCVCVDGDLIVYEGLRILGLGGSMKYDGNGKQYTEKEMKRRARKLRLKLLRHHGFDILLTHAPARGINDSEELPHRGFEVFPELIRKYRPRMMVHGHVHKSYGYQFARCSELEGTKILNACERCVFEIDPETGKISVEDGTGFREN